MRREERIRALVEVVVGELRNELRVKELLRSGRAGLVWPVLGISGAFVAVVS